MSDRTFSDLLAKAYQLYLKKEYAQALDLIEREAGRFPEQENTAYFWRICLVSRMGQPTRAVQFLEEAIAAGHWYREARLQEDEDLEPLQGRPDFERLAAICRERQAQAQAGAEPALVTLPPEGQCGTGDEPCPLLIALHGNTRNAPSSVEYWRSAVARGWLLALPQSSQVSGPDAYVWDDREWTKREIREHHVALVEEYAVDGDRVILGGFSMGGELAIWLVLSDAVEARGFVVVGPGGPYIHQPDKWVPLIEASRERGLRGYIVVGELDVFCLEGSKALATILRSQGIPCEVEVHPDLGHDFPPDFEVSLARGLEFVLGE